MLQRVRMNEVVDSLHFVFFLHFNVTAQSGG